MQDNAKLNCIPYKELCSQLPLIKKPNHRQISHCRSRRLYGIETALCLYVNIDRLLMSHLTPVGVNPGCGPINQARGTTSLTLCPYFYTKQPPQTLTDVASE